MQWQKQPEWWTPKYTWFAERMALHKNLHYLSQNCILRKVNWCKLSTLHKFVSVYWWKQIYIYFFYKTLKGKKLFRLSVGHMWWGCWALFKLFSQVFFFFLNKTNDKNRFKVSRRAYIHLLSNSERNSISIGRSLHYILT